MQIKYINYYKIVIIWINSIIFIMFIYIYNSYVATIEQF